MSEPKLCPMKFCVDPGKATRTSFCEQEGCEWWVSASIKNIAESFAAKNRGDDPMDPLRGHCSIRDIGRAK